MMHVTHTIQTSVDEISNWYSFLAISELPDKNQKSFHFFSMNSPAKKKKKQSPSVARFPVPMGRCRIASLGQLRQVLM
jgi:hypothetical protein